MRVTGCTMEQVHDAARIARVRISELRPGSTGGDSLQFVIRTDGHPPHWGRRSRRADTRACTGCGGDGEIWCRPREASLQIDTGDSYQDVGRITRFKVRCGHCGGSGEETYHRRVPGRVCWHGQRAFMRELLRLVPTAILKTKLATYRGLEHFERWHEETFTRPATYFGGDVTPANQLCDCQSAIDVLTESHRRQGVLREAAMVRGRGYGLSRFLMDAARQARETGVPVFTAVQTRRVRAEVPTDRELIAEADRIAIGASVIGMHELDYADIERRVLAQVAEAYRVPPELLGGRGVEIHGGDHDAVYGTITGRLTTQQPTVEFLSPRDQRAEAGEMTQRAAKLLERTQRIEAEMAEVMDKPNPRLPMYKAQ